MTLRVGIGCYRFSAILTVKNRCTILHLICTVAELKAFSL